MISVESHSKQIKLLNDYIISLEKQISTAKKEQDELQKGSGVSNDEQKRTNEELTKLRNENGQLKYSAYKLDEQLRRFTVLEKELAATRELLSKERQEKQVLAAENSHLREGNSGYEVRKRTSEEELEKRKTAHEEERQKLQNELEDVRKTATLKERRCEELTQLLNQEKKNTASRLFNLEVTNNEVVRLKNDTISKLTRELDQIKSNHNRELASVSENRLSMNDQVRDLVRQLNDCRIQVQNLKREISENRGAGDRKNEELANALNNLQAKSGELDSYIRKSNEQKNNLMKIIDRLEDEKRTLGRQNEGNQSGKLLGEIARERDELRSRLAARQEQLDGLQTQLNEASGHQQHLLQQLQQADLTIQQMDERIQYQIGENQKLDKLLYTSDQLLAEKTTQLEELTATKQQEESRLLEIITNLETERDSKLNSLSTTSLQVNDLNHTIAQLRIQVQELNKTIESITNQSVSQRRTADLEKQSLSTKLKEAEKTIEVSKQELTSERTKFTAQIESLSQQLKDAEKANNSTGGESELERQRKIAEIETLSQQLKSAEKTIETARIQYSNEQKKQANEIETLAHQLQTAEKTIETIRTQREKKEAQLLSLSQKLIAAEQIIETNRNKYCSNLKEKETKIESLSLQLKTAEKTIETNRNQYSVKRKQQEAETELLSEKVEEAEKRSEKNRLKVEELTRNLKQLQAQQPGQIQMPSYSEAEVESLKVRFNKTITDLKTASEEEFYRKNQQILELTLNVERIGEKGDLKVKKLQQEWEAKQEQWKLKEQKLQKQIDTLIQEKQMLQEEYTRSSVSSIIIDNHSTATKDIEIDALKHTIALLQNSVNQQKIVIDNLSHLQAEMHLELQTLQASNTMLRKQVIGAINNEETSRKQLIESRSRNGSVILNNSRINISDVSFEKQYARGSGMTKRRATASNSLFGNLLDGRLNSSSGMDRRNRDRKKSTQLKSSLVDELRVLNNDRSHLLTEDDENLAEQQ